MFTVRVTYYDSPREDCSGFYFTDYDFPTAKEAYQFAFHRNRMNEPWVVNVDLSSGKPRKYKIFVNNSKFLETFNVIEFREQVEEFRRWKLKDANMRGLINYRFEIS